MSELGSSQGNASVNGFLPYDVRPKKNHIQRIHKANSKARQIRLFVSSTFLYEQMFPCLITPTGTWQKNDLCWLVRCFPKSRESASNVTSISFMSVSFLLFSFTLTIDQTFVGELQRKIQLEAKYLNCVWTKYVLLLYHTYSFRLIPVVLTFWVSWASVTVGVSLA